MFFLKLRINFYTYCATNKFCSFVDKLLSTKVDFTITNNNIPTT